MPKTQKKAPAAIEPMTAVLRSTESGSDIIKNYGKIEAVVEMYQDGTMDPGKALKRIIEIVKGVQHA
jgi:hypothetical protein